MAQEAKVSSSKNLLQSERLMICFEIRLEKKKGILNAFIGHLFPALLFKKLCHTLRYRNTGFKIKFMKSEVNVF